MVKTFLPAEWTFWQQNNLSKTMFDLGQSWSGKKYQLRLSTAFKELIRWPRNQGEWQRSLARLIRMKQASKHLPSIASRSIWEISVGLVSGSSDLQVSGQALQTQVTAFTTMISCGTKAPSLYLSNWDRYYDSHCILLMEFSPVSFGTVCLKKMYLSSVGDKIKTIWPIFKILLSPNQDFYFSF